MAQTRSALHRSLAASARIESAIRGRVLLSAICVVLVAFTAAGCTYRMNIQQGNVVEMEDLNQVREGMTRSQVQFLLGTPMISDPFHADRWDYTYYFRQGRRRNITRHWVTIHFDEDRVVRIETHIPPPGGQNAEVAARDG